MSEGLNETKYRTCSTIYRVHQAVRVLQYLTLTLLPIAPLPLRELPRSHNCHNFGSLFYLFHNIIVVMVAVVAVLALGSRSILFFYYFAELIFPVAVLIYRYIFVTWRG